MRVPLPQHPRTLPADVTQFGQRMDGVRRRFEPVGPREMTTLDPDRVHANAARPFDVDLRTIANIEHLVEVQTERPYRSFEHQPVRLVATEILADDDDIEGQTV